MSEARAWVALNNTGAKFSSAVTGAVTKATAKAGQKVTDALPVG